MRNNLVRLLLERGADSNLRTFDGYTPLMLGAKNLCILPFMRELILWPGLYLNSSVKQLFVFDVMLSLLLSDIFVYDSNERECSSSTNWKNSSSLSH
jgi:hypothetical protein